MLVGHFERQKVDKDCTDYLHGFKNTEAMQPEDNAIDEGSTTGLHGSKRDPDIAIRHELDT